MTQKTMNKKGILYLSLALGGALIGAALNFIALRFFSDVTDIGEVHKTVLFQKGPMTVVLAVVLIAFALFFLSAFFVFKKVKTKDLQPTLRIPRYFLTAACGMALFFTVPLQFILNTTGTAYALKNTAFSLRDSSSMQRVSLILAVIASFYFFIALFIEKKSKLLSIARTGSGLLLVLYFCAQLLVTHNYMNDMLDSPTRIFNLTSTCFIVFFLLCEINLAVKGREKPALFAATGLCAFLFTVTETLPILTLSFMNSSGYSVDINIFYLLLRLFIGVYALLSVIPVLFAGAAEEKEPEEGPAVKEPTEQNEEEQVCEEQAPEEQPNEEQGEQNDAE